jgi:hypothetical protein
MRNALTACITEFIVQPPNKKLHDAAYERVRTVLALYPENGGAPPWSA